MLHVYFKIENSHRYLIILPIMRTCFYFVHVGSAWKVGGKHFRIYAIFGVVAQIVHSQINGYKVRLSLVTFSKD